ncbi:hypothetical protein [uncultured Ruminococcus sp.]|uniref:hypothetical protein n=1 Tax=uncultured Ruminococcus sp. TaxID=165186 RepID=UPI0025E5A872|nr:hypothetical protein [uncultured Ruminococcus sp.]
MEFQVASLRIYIDACCEEMFVPKNKSDISATFWRTQFAATILKNHLCGNAAI